MQIPVATTMPAAPTIAPATASAAPKAAAAAATVARPAGWRGASHGNQAAPNYAVVFPQDRVNQITITIDAQNWVAMQADIARLLGARGAGGAPPDMIGDRPSPGALPPPDAAPPAGQPPAEGGAPGGRGGGWPGRMGGNPDMTPVNPAWVEATVAFGGQRWTHVGVRYKGNSTLTRAWRQGSAKLPLKLDFDQFEDAHPEIKNQRFYGFKQLSLANNLGDASYLRDALAYDIMAAAGLVTPRTAFYEVILDHGEGPVSLGLYTMVEVVDDTVVERAFADASGNIYEADGIAASFAAGTAGQIQASFQKESNQAAADWSDLQALYDVLHSPQRTADPVKWRAALAAVFDVNAFLEWLAVNAVIQDWDTYGAMNHNYYLYHDPTTGRLAWIAWDHNEAFTNRGRGDTSLDKAGVGENWPLIRYLLDDPTYRARYVAYLRSTLAEAFVPATLATKLDAWVRIIQPYADKAGQGAAFAAAVEQLKTFTTQRVSVVEAFLAGQK